MGKISKGFMNRLVFHLFQNFTNLNHMPFQMANEKLKTFWQIKINNGSDCGRKLYFRNVLSPASYNGFL